MILRFAAALLLALLSGSAWAGEGEVAERLALVAGASSGGPGRATLRYATSDAREVARVLTQLGGVEPDDLVLLEEPDASGLRTAIGALRRRAGEVRARGRRPELFVYYSGHSDEDGLLLGETRLPYAELRRELDEVPVDVRVAILDSCASGAFTRVKGGQMRPAFQVDEANRVRGHAFLTSSAADEASQESDRLRASFFTHALLTGLRGAADSTGDGVVTLNEAYQFAFRETLARTEATRSGPQHATYDIALVGSGEVIVTDLRRAGAVLTLPESLAGRVFVRNASDLLVAELRKTSGSRTQLAVDPGNYRVRVAREGKLLEVRVALASGEQMTLPEAGLEPVPLEATAARGPGADPLDGELEPAAPAARTGSLAGRSLLTVTLGGATLQGDHGIVTQCNPQCAEVPVRASDQVGGLFELGYERWFTDRIALEAGALARGIQGDEQQVGNQKTSQGSMVLGMTLGAKYTHPLVPRRGVYLSAGGSAGAFLGVHGTSTGSNKSSSHESEWAPGARLRLSLDYFPLRRLLLRLGGGYDQIGRFHRFIGARRDYSGFDFALSFGYGWGGR